MTKHLPHGRAGSRGRLGRSLRTISFPLLAFAILAGCGGGDDGDDNNPVNPGPAPGGGSGPMSATIDGQAWVSDAVSANAQLGAGLPGSFVIMGNKVISSTDAISIQLIVYNVDGPGTYPLGTGPTVDGGHGIVASAAVGFATPLNGNAGSVTITTLTPTRIAGTFSFVANQNYGGTGGTRTVTNGQFDLTLNSGGSLPVLPANKGGRILATFNGTSWNAATAVAQYASGALIVVASTDQYVLSMALSAVPGTGTYTITDTDFTKSIAVNAGVVPSGECCWSPGPGQSGTVTITTLDANRVVGTFEATVPASGASGPLTIASGTFDLGLL